MIILVTGDRSFNKREFIFATLDNLVEEDDIEAVIHGNAQGAERLADAWCLSRGVQPIRCPALFQKIPDAGRHRNQIMISLDPDLVVAFIDKVSNEDNTFDIIEKAHQNDIEVVKYG
jgi:hypothetical protein